MHFVNDFLFSNLCHVFIRVCVTNGSSVIFIEIRRINADPVEENNF